MAAAIYIIMCSQVSTRVPPCAPSRLVPSCRLRAASRSVLASAAVAVARSSARGSGALASLPPFAARRRVSLRRSFAAALPPPSSRRDVVSPRLRRAPRRAPLRAFGCLAASLSLLVRRSVLALSVGVSHSPRRQPRPRPSLRRQPLRAFASGVPSASLRAQSLGAQAALGCSPGCTLLYI